MAQIPEIDKALNTTFNYVGSVSELPEDGTEGQIFLETGSNILYVSNNGASWVELGSLLTPTKTIKEELLEVLDRHKGSKIAEDIRNLLKVYEKNSYI